MESSTLQTVVADNLSYLGSIAQLEYLGADLRVFLAREVESLTKRFNSNELQLSIFGEFNTGKSTFINALLGQEILTAQRRPTTQVCVYVRYGKRLRILAAMPDGTVEDVPLENASDVLSEQGRLKHAARVDVFVPNEVLRSGLTIVDTPGINVDIESHIRITEHALSESNACIFMMSARQPGSRTSVEYLKRISASVDKFFVVLNMCDLLDQEEISEALEYLTCILRDECGIQKPRIYALSLLRGTGGALGPEGTEFRAFLDRLNSFVKTEKHIILAREIAKLQEKVISEASRMAENRRRLYEEELERRYDQAMPDSETLVARLLENTRSRIEGAMEDISARANEYARSKIAELRTDIEERISSARKKAEFREEVPRYIESALSACAKSIGDMLLGEYDQLFREGISSIDSTFAGLFANVRNLNLKLMFRDSRIYWFVIPCEIMGILVAWGYWRHYYSVALSGIAGALVGFLAFYLTFTFEMQERYRVRPAIMTDLDMHVANRLSIQELKQSTAWPAARKVAELGLRATVKAPLRHFVCTGDPKGMLVTIAVTVAVSLGTALAESALERLSDWLFGRRLNDVKNEMRTKVAHELNSFSGRVIACIHGSLESMKCDLVQYCEDRIRQLDKRYDSLIVEFANRDRSRIAEVEKRVNSLREIESELGRRTSTIQEQLRVSKQLLTESP